MANMLLGWVNRIVLGALTAGSQAAGQPVTNLQTGQCSPATAWQTTSGITTSYFVVDAGIVSTWRAFLLARTNLSAAATVRWRVGSLEGVSGGAPSYTFASMASAMLIGFTAIDLTAIGPQTGSETVTLPAYFVSPSGLDTNSGTESAPFKTIDKAHLAMRASGTTKKTYLRSGRYTPTQMIMAPADSNTTYTRYPNEFPVVDGVGTVDTPFLVNPNTSGITFNGIEFVNCVTAAIDLHGYTSQPVTGCTISNCYVHRITGDTSGGAGATGGIRLSYNVTGCSVIHNRVTDTVGPAITLVAGDGAGEANNKNVVEYNSIARCNNLGFADTGAIYCLDRNHTGVSGTPGRVRFNYIEDAGDGNDVRGIYFDDQYSCVNCHYNIIVGSMSFPITVHGGDHVSFRNNILDVSETRNYMGLYQNAPSPQPNYAMGSNEFVANIVYSSGPIYPASQMWAYFIDSGVTVSKPTVNTNLYWRVGGSLPYAAGDIPDTAATVADPYFAPIASAVAYDSGTIPANVLPGFLQSLTVAPTGVLGQFCRCDISDVNNPDGFLNIPAAFAGDCWQPSINYSEGSAQGRDDNTQEFTTRGGQEYPRLLYQRRRLEIAMDNLRSSDLWTQVDQLDQVARQNWNVLAVPDPDSSDRNRAAVFGRFKSKSDIGYATTLGNFRSWRASITERL